MTCKQLEAKFYKGLTMLVAGCGSTPKLVKPGQYAINKDQSDKESLLLVVDLKAAYFLLDKKLEECGLCSADRKKDQSSHA